MKLPSKNLVIITGLCAISLSGAIWYTVAKNTKNEKVPTRGLVVVDQKSATNTPALKDRSFYEQTIATNTEKSLTKQVSREFFLDFVELNNSGNWNIDSQAALIEKLSTDYASSSYSHISAESLTVFSDLDTAKIRVFGNTVAQIAANHSRILQKSPIDVMNETLENPAASTTLPAKLKPYAAEYRALVKDLKKVATPVSAAALYADIINTYSDIAVHIDYMGTYHTDKIRSFIGTQQYITSLTNQMELLKTLSDYFASSAIMFNKTEAGYVWSSFLQ